MDETLKEETFIVSYFCQAQRLASCFQRPYLRQTQLTKLMS
jgi:hypothetical protein